jgi:hypothetical protein
MVQTFNIFMSSGTWDVRRHLPMHVSAGLCDPDMSVVIMWARGNPKLHESGHRYKREEDATNRLENVKRWNC